MGIPTPGRLLWAVAVATTAGIAAADCGVGCGGSLAGTPADEFVAERLGLAREWVVQLPFDSAAASVQHVTIGDGLVVARTGDGGVHAVKSAGPARPGEPATGTLLWSKRLGGRGVATPAGVGPRLVTATSDLELFAVDRDTGAGRWQRPLGRMPETGAVEIGDWVYAPLEGGGIRRLTFDPLQPTADTAAPPVVPTGKKAKAAGQKAKKKPADARPTAESLRPRTLDGGGRIATPLVPLAKGLAWTTADGMLVTLQQGDLGWERFEFDLNSPAVPTPVVRGNAIFVATQASDLARVDLLETGGTGLRTGWHVVLDTPPDAGPFVGGDAVVVSLGDAGLAAFAAETGALLWRTDVAGHILAISGDRVWIIDRTGRLAGIDLASGERRERICLGGFSVPVVNVATDRLILASPDGLLVSLAPRRPAAAPAAEKPEPAPAAAPAPAVEEAEPADEAADAT
jgi:outer membrane protein assembly factor BamB